MRNFLFTLAMTLCVALLPSAALAQMTTGAIRLSPMQVSVGTDQLLSQRYPAYVSARPISQAPLASVPRALLPTTGSRAPLYVTDGGTEIWGSLISTTSWTEQTKQEGMYSFNTAATGVNALAIDSCLTATGGGAYWNNVLLLRELAFHAVWRQRQLLCLQHGRLEQGL